MNKNTLNLFPDILDKSRKDLLDKLTPFAKKFVLGGGTALSLQVGHRKSFDFDFFSSSPIEKKLVEKVSQQITIATISVDTSDELTLFTADGVKITFLSYPFKHNFDLVTWRNYLQLFSVKDIAIQKAYTIGRRGEYRDYFDLYTIFKNDYIHLSELISVAGKMYGTLFSEKIFLEQLVYFGDLLSFDIVPVSSASIPSPDDVKRFFEDLVRNYV